jgi:ribosomal protein S30
MTLLERILTIPKVRPVERLVLLQLALRANRDGMVVMRKRELLAATECSNMTIVTALKRLRTKGLLRWGRGARPEPAAAVLPAGATAMSAHATGQVWKHSRAKGSPLLVLLAIADIADEQGRNAWPSPEHLAEKSRMTARAMRLILHRLERDGELTIELNADRRPVRSGYTPAWFLHVRCVADPDAYTRGESEKFSETPFPAGRRATGKVFPSPRPSTGKVFRLTGKITYANRKNRVPHIRNRPSVQPSVVQAGAPPRAPQQTDDKNTPEHNLGIITKLAHQVYDLLGRLRRSGRRDRRGQKRVRAVSRRLQHRRRAEGGRLGAVAAAAAAGGGALNGVDVAAAPHRQRAAARGAVSRLPAAHSVGDAPTGKKSADERRRAVRVSRGADRARALLGDRGDRGASLPGTPSRGWEGTVDGRGPGAGATGRRDAAADRAPAADVRVRRCSCSARGNRAAAVSSAARSSPGPTGRGRRQAWPT